VKNRDAEILPTVRPGIPVHEQLLFSPRACCVRHTWSTSTEQHRCGKNNGDRKNEQFHNSSF